MIVCFAYLLVMAINYDMLCYFTSIYSNVYAAALHVYISKVCNKVNHFKLYSSLITSKCVTMLSSNFS